jgi:hypothetical protein
LQVRVLASLSSPQRARRIVPAAVRIQEQDLKNLALAPRRFFSARLTMHIGSDSQSADDAHCLLTVSGGCPVISRPREGIGTPEPAHSLFPVLIGKDTELVEETIARAK